MQLNNDDVGKNLYFVTPLGEDLPVLVEKGELTFIMPKFGLKDGYTSKEGREMIYVFCVKRFGGDSSVMCPSNKLIFNNINDLIAEYRGLNIDLVFGWGMLNEIN